MSQAHHLGELLEQVRQRPPQIGIVLLQRFNLFLVHAVAVGMGRHLIEIICTPPLEGHQLLDGGKVNMEDKQKIEQRAANAGMTVTDYLTTRALEKKIVRVDGLDKILTELKAQGRNLNKLIVLANMERLTIVRGDDLADGYAALCEQVHCLAREVQ